MNKIVLFLIALFLGVFGIHDFLLKRVKRGILHLLLTVAGFILMMGSFIFVFIIELLSLGYADPQQASIFIYVGVGVLGVSGLWAVYDAFVILIDKRATA